MPHRFNYLLEKISKAQFKQKPYQHLYIENFFSLDDFNEIVGCDEIKINDKKNDQQLFADVFRSGYKIVNFPGCITDLDEYINWRNTKKTSVEFNPACEGFGVTMRLFDIGSKVIQDLNNFLLSDDFNETLKKKFNLKKEYTVDCGIQKYLDGYEISPHCDVRKKALTYMININPHINSEENEHHTHYLTFKKKYSFLENFWSSCDNIERSWIPWEWAQTEFKQSKNNSIIIFSPSNNTLHAVKAKYDHLKYQRTQCYGNLWVSNYKDELTNYQWQDYDKFINGRIVKEEKNLIKRLYNKIIKYKNAFSKKPQDNNKIGVRDTPQ